MNHFFTALILIVLTAFAMLAHTQTSIHSQTDAFNMGKSFAQSGANSAAAAVNSNTASAYLPNFTTSAPQSTSFGNGKGDVGSAGSSKQLACRNGTQSMDAFAQQECDAVNYLSNHSAVRRKYNIKKDDPLFSNSASIIDNAKLDASSGGMTSCIDKTMTIAPAVHSKEFCEQMLTPEDHVCDVTKSASVNQYGIFSCQKTRLTTSVQQCSSVKYSDYRVDTYRAATKVPTTCGGDATIQSWYNQYAGRCADVEGMNFWTNALNTSQSVTSYSPTKVAMTCGGDATIQGWYNNYAGRCADVDGLNWWVSQLPSVGNDYSKLFPGWYAALQGGYPGGVTKDQFFCGSSGTLSGTQCASQTYKYPTYVDIFPAWSSALGMGYPGGQTKDQWLCNAGGHYIYQTTQCEQEQITMLPTYQCTGLEAQSGSGSSLTYPVLIPSTCGGDSTIQSWYSQYDSRCADIAGMNYWTDQLQTNFGGNYSQMFEGWYTAFLRDGGKGAIWPSLCNQGDEYLLNTTNCSKRIYTTSDSCKKQNSICLDSTPVKYFNGIAVNVSQVGGCWEYQDTYKCNASTQDATCNPIASNSACQLLNTTCVNTAFNGDCMQQKLTYKCGDPAATIPGATLDQISPEISSISSDISQCVPYATNADCTQVQNVCVEPDAVKMINGVPVYQDCWRWEKKYTCASGQPSSDCQDLALKGCVPATSTCMETTPSGRCAFQQIEYSCEVKPAVTQVVKDCGAQQFCMPNQNGQQACFDTGYSPDQDFANAAAMSEVAREAGVYGIDPSKVEIFKGYAEQCSVKVLGGANLKSCCNSSGGGAAYSNHAVLSAGLSAGAGVAGAYGKDAIKTGSSYVYDALYGQTDSTLINKGLTSMNNWAADLSTSTNFGVYGFTFEFSVDSGFAFTGFDPSTFAISIALQMAMQWLSCSPEESTLSMKKGQNLCVFTGSYCSSRIPIIGVCTEVKQKSCCFNSILAKIVNQQGRVQLGLPTNQCGGFNQAQIQAIDFSKIDFSEFIASINVNTPSSTSVTDKVNSSVQQKVKNYYEQ